MIVSAILPRDRTGHVARTVVVSAEGRGQGT
jgi:hypothetical protein